MKKKDDYMKSAVFYLVPLAVLTLSGALRAQEEAPEASTQYDASNGDESKPPETAEPETSTNVQDSTSPAETQKPAPDQAEDAKPEAAPATDAKSETAPAPDAKPETADESSETDESKPGRLKKFAAEAEEFFATIGIRVLKDEAYPTYLTRGIVGGSLWRTFHGLQWPYMPESGIGISGSAWVDTGYEKIDREEDPNQPDTKYLLQTGRFVLRVTPTYSYKKRWFVQGQAELVANSDQNATQPDVADVDDLWIRVGIWNIWDLQVGRFEGWELYHFGMGMDLNTLERKGAVNSGKVSISVPEVYGVTSAYYRPSGLGNAAVHIYPTKFLRFELLGQLGNDGSQNSGTFRGAGILDFGFVKVKGGGEYKHQASHEGGSSKRAERGVGGTVQFVLNPYVEFGGSGAWSITDHMSAGGSVDETKSYTTWSAGGFANVRIVENLLFGAGVHYTRLWDIHEDENGDVNETSHLQTFGALQYCLFDRLYIKLVGAWARGHVSESFSEGDPYAVYMVSGRLRLQYDF